MSYRRVYLLFIFMFCFVGSLYLKASSVECLSPWSNLEDLKPLEFILSENGVLDCEEGLVLVGASPILLLSKEERELYLDLSDFTKIDQLFHRLRLGIGAGTGGTDDLILRKAMEENPKAANVLDVIAYDEGNLALGMGWNQGQEVLYAPTFVKSTKSGESKDLYNYQRFVGAYKAALLYAKEKGIDSVALPPIGINIQGWTVSEFLEMLEEAKKEAMYSGQIRIYFRQRDQRDICLKASKDFTAPIVDSLTKKENAYEYEMVLTKRLVNLYGMHLRPSTDLIKYCTSSGVKIIEISQVDEEGHPIAEKTVMNENGVGMLEVISMGYLSGAILKMSLRIPQKLDHQEVKDDFETLFEGFKEYTRNEEGPESTGDSSIERISLSTGIPSLMVIQDPRFARIKMYFGERGQIPIVFHPPRNIQNELQQFRLVSERIESSEMERFGGQSEGIREIEVLKKLRANAESLMNENNKFNAEYALGLSGIRLKNSLKLKLREGRIEVEEFEADLDSIDRYVEDFVFYMRSPFYFGIRRNSSEIESEYYRLALDMAMKHSRTLRSLIRHVDPDGALRISKDIELILKKMEGELRKEQVFPWASLSRYMEERIVRLKRSSERNSTGVREMLQEKLIRMKLLSRLFQLYRLGESFLAGKPNFDISLIESVILESLEGEEVQAEVKAKFLIRKEQVKDDVANLTLSREYLTHWDASLLYSFLCDILYPGVTSHSILEALENMEAMKGMDVFEEKRATLLFVKDHENIDILKQLSKTMNILGIVVEEEDGGGNRNRQWVRDVRKVFPQALVLHAKGESYPVGSYENKSTLRVSEFEGEIVINPNDKEYELSQRLQEQIESELSAFERTGEVLWADGEPLEGIVRHSKKKRGTLSRVIRLDELYLGKKTFPQESEIIEFLKDFHEKHPQGEPFIVSIFQNYHANEMRGKIVPELGAEDVELAVKNQIRALAIFYDSILSKKEDIPIYLVPQCEAFKNIEKELDGLPKSAFKDKAKIADLITSPRLDNSGEVLYVHLNSIVDQLQGSQGVLNKGFIEFLKELALEDEKGRDVILTGDHLALPEVMTLIQGLNLIRIGRGEKPMKVAPRGTSLYGYKKYFSSLTPKMVKERVSRLLGLKMFGGNRVKVGLVDDFKEWCLEGFRKAIFERFRVLGIENMTIFKESA